MKIWVDADACPVVIKQILFRASERTGVEVTLVANHTMHIPRSNTIRFIQVSSGFDVADNEIVKRVGKEDVVITSDIPLAADVIEKGAVVLSSRGELLTTENIRTRLSMRDFMETLRSSGMDAGGGPPPLSKADRQIFSNHLDQLLQKALKNA
ncbi:MAG: Unknown protein [uncultured Thiotrichaceae bacterium]|uniref:UPF0178 protein HELGO_WM10963 n=1 Tax=uncultured Thiotrichaceae bacterium TaxID=298394 RepID=A0A6S6S0F6_9GAMM|nr:MAG: Unknown protein [uncultured Thiotrichaceae bacterium]